MKKIKVNAKTIPTKEETIVKINEGFRNLEMQLISRKVTEEEYKNTENMICNDKIDISVVHTPLITYNKDISEEIELSMDRLLIPEYFEMFEDTCKYAQFIADIEQKRIKVVIHNDFAKNIWKETNLIEEKIGQKIKSVLDRYPEVDLVVENGSAISEKNFNTIFNMEDVTYAVKELNKIVGNKVKTLIDTCHIMMNWEAWKRVTDGEDVSSWENVFKQASDGIEIGLIHLNNMRDNGIVDHGLAFDSENEEDMEKLKQIMENYEKYTDCEITIEVREEDYLARPYNLLTTKKALETLGYELVIE